MKNFPMFLKMTGRRALVLGGGEQAAQKTRLLLKTEAQVTAAAPAVEPELASLAAAGRIAHHDGRVDRDLLTGAALAFVATGCRGADAALAAVARDCGVLVNVVDAPDLCDAFTPSIVDRDPVVVAIGTEGAAPVLARQIKTRIETILEPRLGELAALAGRLRTEVAARIPHAQRRAFWDWVFGGDPRRAHARGAEREAARMVKAAIAASAAPATHAPGARAPGAQEPGAHLSGAAARATAGLVSLVGAGPGSPDLITLRGVQRLQEADIVFFDRLVDPGLLELARRDAERVYVGKAPGATAWPQDRINGVLVAAGRQGKRVVRLKCGDPGIFARGAEEAAALAAAGVPWEVVPGVTAASAAAAETGAFLTARGRTDTLVLCTGQLRPGDPSPDWAQHAKPGVMLAVYMGVAAAGEIQAALIAAGAPGDAPVEIVCRASQPNARVLRTRLDDLAATILRDTVENPAMLLIAIPKAGSAARISIPAPRVRVA